MKLTTISIRQPWVEFIMAGLKEVENRVWYASHRGVLLIHAGKQLDDGWRGRFQSIIALDQARRHMDRLMVARQGRMRWQLGEVVGAVIMTGCDTTTNNRWCEHGAYYHRYREAYRFKKGIPWKGMQKLFQISVTEENSTAEDLKQLKRMEERSAVWKVTE